MRRLKLKIQSISKCRAILQPTRCFTKKMISLHPKNHAILHATGIHAQVISAKMNHTQKTRRKSTDHYTPSSQMADKLAANRAGKLTRSQRQPILIAALFSGIGLVIAVVFGAIMVWGFAQTLAITGIFGGCMVIFTGLGFVFMIIVLWTNSEMFVPEALSKSPVRWQRAPLEIKRASRNRPEMPFSYIVGSYSFGPFVVPEDVPMDKGREYIVYYTPRSRLLLSIAPTDQPESSGWLPLSDS